jgi:bacteriocin biosynthesis cyclodehydratase domain-containing protein
MIYRLDPRIPFVWRTPSSVQLGIDPPLVVIDEVTAPQERMLAALTVGVTLAGLHLVAKASAATRDEFLELVAPALDRPMPDPTPWAVTICGRGIFIDLLAPALAAEGVAVTIVHELADLPESRPNLAIIVASHVIPPAFHGVWLRRDVPHLPVVFSETSSVIGPLVRPGASACLVCLELHRRDADPSWPAIATQLLSRGGGADASALLLESAAIVCRIVAALRFPSPANVDGSAASVRIDGVTGAREGTRWDAHAGCGCRGIPPLATARPRENDWAAAARGPA